MPRGGLDEALPLLEDYGRSAAAIIFDWCSPNRYDLGPLTELSLRRPEVQQLVFHPHRFEDADGEALARHPGIHLFRTPLADSSSYQVISNTLQEVFVEEDGHRDPISPLDPVACHGLPWRADLA